MAYILSGKKCGTVRFDEVGTVKSEGKNFSGKVTSYPVEENFKASDHFEKDPVKGSISGILIDGGSSVAVLEKMCDEGDILTYEGSFRMDSIVLTSLDFSTDSSNRSGFTFTANYQRVDIVGSRYVPVGEVPPMSEQDEGKSSTAKDSGKASQAGLKTTVTESISNSAYANYVDSFNGSGKGSSRGTPSNNGY